MRYLIAYASTEGHTRTIARHVADHIFTSNHSIELLSLADAPAEGLDRFDGVILAGSIHVGHYQTALTDFVSNSTDQLNAHKTLFLSVSLAAAGHDAEDWRGLDAIMAELKDATGWSPGETLQVAGAYAPSRYDFFRRFAMRRIIAKRDPDHDPENDKVYTDWAALDDGVDQWIAGNVS